MTTSLSRTLTALNHQEPDRVPLFLLFSHYGAKELGIPIETYFHDVDSVVKGQLSLLEKYQHDCAYTFSYASLETEAFGGDTIFFEDGPPNSAAPILHDANDIQKLEVPVIDEQDGLKRVLEVTRLLKRELEDQTPIVGVVMSPFSLPIMQLGFERYMDLLAEAGPTFWKLMEINEAFCVAWANAQLDAGATAICYFDPMSSPTVITPAQYRATGKKIAQRTISAINGPTATHMASGRALQVMDDIADTGTMIVGVSSDEDLSELKHAAQKRLTLLGNLNGIEMCRWTPAQAQEITRKAIAKAGQGGGFLLAENHGEVPWQVHEDTLLVIRDTVMEWGTYPLNAVFNAS